MKKIIATAVLLAATLPVSLRTFADDPSYLPEVEVNGIRCYYYTADKGESVFGITEKFGWNPEVFIKFNPEATDIKNGQVVYYPINTTDAASLSEPDNGAAVDAITGATVDVSKNTVGNVDAKESTDNSGALDLNTPSIGQIENKAPKLEEKIYIAKKGQSIVDIARTNEMSVVQLMKQNPGLTLGDIPEGTELKVTPGSNMTKAQYAEVIDYQQTGVKSHKVKKNETWLSIAKKNNIDTLQLKYSNPTVTTLNKGVKIVIPQFKTTTVNKWIPVLDKRENTPLGLQQIYEETHTQMKKESGLASTILNIAVLVSGNDASDRRRDLEFLKGFMLGLQGTSYPGVNVNIKGLDLADYGSLKNLIASGELNDCGIIICSVDKDFPQELVDYSDKHDKMLFNVFDARTDISKLAKNTVQILPSSEYFYDRASDFLTRVMNDRIFIFVDALNDDPESMCGAIRTRLLGNAPERMVDLPDARALAEYDFNPLKSYIVVSDAGNKAEISSTLAALEKAVDQNPNMPLGIVGRASWIVYSNSLEKLFRKLDTYIPSRFIYDSDSAESKEFITKYRSYYNEAPLNSLPMYSIMGYDIADYFVDQYIKHNGDLNFAEPGEGQIQIEFRPDREKMYDGIVNKRIYLLHFTPFSTTEKISL